MPSPGEPARPLRDVFSELVGSADARGAHAADPAGFLAAHGHPALPADLVSEAIVSYADTAPAEVAEHLAPFVIAHSPVPVDEPDALDGLHGLNGVDGLGLLASAPTGPAADDLAADTLVDHLADPFDIDAGHTGPDHAFGGDFGLGDQDIPAAGELAAHTGHVPADAHPDDLQPDDLHRLEHDSALDGTPEAGGWLPDDLPGEDHHTMYDAGHDPGVGLGEWLPDPDAHHPVPPEDLTDL